MGNDKLFIKIIDNKILIKKRNQIIINDGNLQYINPTEKMILENGWEIYNDTVPDDEIVNENIITIESVRENKINQILEYDASEHVNLFTFNNYPIWLDKATRSGLKLRIEAELMNEKKETTLWYNNIEFKLPTEYAQQLLYRLEIYASECYDNTQRHIANVMKLETIEEINNYDILDGYPLRLAFNFE